VSDISPETRLWDFLRGALATRALGLVADLGIADALSCGPRPVHDLARETGADPDTLHRVLRALASDGVFAEEEQGVFRNTEASEALRRGGGWDDFAHLFGGVWHRAAGELDATSSDPSFPRIFGIDFWSWLARNPSERAAFDRAMVEGTDRRIERLAAVDWDGDETTRDEAALGDRCTFVAGDFFERVPPGDVYILATILHDWDDEHAAAILTTIRAAAAAGTRLLVLESVIQPGNEPDGAKWLDLLMLALFGGRERDEAQWRTLLADAGFETLRIEDGLVEARCR
jgi:O-methyltransferase domain